MSPQSEYDRQRPYLPLSSCSWDSSSSLEAMSGNRDASGHVMAKGGTKSDIFAPRHDYLTSGPTTGPHMRRSYTEAAKVDCSFDCHSEQHYKGLDRFTPFANCNGQSIECRSEVYLWTISCTGKKRLHAYIVVYLTYVVNSQNLFVYRYIPC